MKVICAHFAPVEPIRGCSAGRIAFVDCALTCATYLPEDDISRRSEEELEMWSGHLLDLDAMDGDD